MRKTWEDILLYLMIHKILINVSIYVTWKNFNLREASSHGGMEELMKIAYSRD